MSRQWSSAQAMAAGRLLALVDELHDADGDRRRGLLKEIRIGEDHLGLGTMPPGKKSAPKRIDPQQWRAERNAERLADPANRTNWTELTADEIAKAELAVFFTEEPVDLSTVAGRRRAVKTYDMKGTT